MLVQCRPRPGSWQGRTQPLALGCGAMPGSLAGAAGAMAAGWAVASECAHVHKHVCACTSMCVPMCTTVHAAVLVPTAAAFGLGLHFGCKCIPCHTSDGRCF